MPPLDAATEQRVRAEAARRGVDPDAALSHARALSSDDSSPPGRPIFDRMLIGALPFVTVREFRSVWLGLDERVPDDDMMCGDFAAKHGAASPTSATATA